MEIKFKTYGEKIDNFILKQKTRVSYERARVTIKGGKKVMVAKAVKLLLEISKEKDPEVISQKKKELNGILLSLEVINFLNPEV